MHPSGSISVPHHTLHLLVNPKLHPYKDVHLDYLFALVPGGPLQIFGVHCQSWAPQKQLPGTQSGLDHPLPLLVEWPVLLV